METLRRYSPLAARCVVVLAILALPGGLAAQPARPPAPIRDVDNPARHPFQTSGGFIDFNPGDFAVVVDLPVVPAGKIFVIEFVSGEAQLPTGQKVRLTLFVDDGASIVQQYFAPTLVGTDFTVDHFSMSQPTRLYATSTIRVNATRFPSNAGAGSVRLGFSGYLLDR